MSNAQPPKIDQLIDSSERIGVIGSPSSTNELSLDILASAVNKKLVGELAILRFLQDSSQHYALGQITEVTLRNTWHEDPTMRSLIRQRGRVDAVSGRQDTHQGEMTISAVFADGSSGYLPSMLGTVPATGTPIHLADDNVLGELLAPYKKQLFYLGRIYGSSPKLPLWFKHFDTGQDGAGEAYHVGIFGKTGSGKSVLSKMALLAYAKHKQMGLFVLDPQGEFSLGLGDQNRPTRMGKILCPLVLNSINREFQLYDLTKIQLDRWEVFRELLIEFNFFFDLGIKTSNYQEAAGSHIEDFLRKNHKFSDLSDQSLIAVLDELHDNIHRIYAGGTSIDRVQEFINEAKDSLVNANNHPVIEKWRNTVRFFKGSQGAKSPTQIVKAALTANQSGRRPLVIVDLSQRPQDVTQSVWDDKIKPLLIDRFIDALIREAESAYQNEKSLNTLVVLDEAHRLAPQERLKNDRAESIKANLIDAVRTTRKYGLGWMFLSQTLSSLHNEIVQQLRISFFGFGLSMGTEFQKLRELVGGQKESISLYQRFKDPQSSFDTNSKEYSFMSIGPISPLSFSGTPLFFSAFNTVDEFIATNGFSLQGKLFP